MDLINGIESEAGFVERFSDIIYASYFLCVLGSLWHL